MFGDLRTIIAFVVDIGILIFVHELGHYLAARSQGVAVEVFSIGFGPALLKWRARSGTVWQVSVLPLGGYVKMQGWGEEEQGASAPAPGSFTRASLGSKALIVSAGPLANLALAYVILAGLFMSVGQAITQPVFSQILPNSPAAAAQLQAGDRVLAIGDGKISDFAQLQAVVTAHPDAMLDFTVQRGATVFTRSIALGDVTEGGSKAGRLGVEANQVSFRHFGPVAALGAAWNEECAEIAAWGTGIGALILHHQGLSQLSGPLGIAQITGQVAALGLLNLVSFVAILSINLGLVKFHSDSDARWRPSRLLRRRGAAAPPGLGKAARAWPAFWRRGDFLPGFAHHLQ